MSINTKDYAVIKLASNVKSYPVFNRNSKGWINYDRDNLLPQRIIELNNQIEYYREKTVEDKQKLQELQSDKDRIEKFARENYLMKKEDEDVFIVE